MYTHSNCVHPLH